MTFIETIAPENADEAVEMMYDRHAAAWGFLPNYSRAFSLRPGVMDAWSELQSVIRRNLGARRYELVTFVAARELRSTYCSLAHYRALGKLLSPDELDALLEESGGQPVSLPAADAELVSFVRRLVRAPWAVSGEDIERLRSAGLSDRDVFDVVSAAAARMFFASVLDGLGVQADADFRKIDARARSVLVSGRPISPVDDGDGIEMSGCMEG